MKQLLDERRVAEYEDSIQEFKEKIKGINLKGIPEPHLPVFGRTYDKSKYKFVFCGMETFGWGQIEDFVERTPYDSVFASDYTINDFEYLGYPKNYHATFWGFILKFLSKFYDIPFENLINKSNPDILQSFIWMNANSIERYSVTAEKENADPDSWKIVKEASKAFDDLNHVLRIANPKVVFILSSNTKREYYLNLQDYGLNVENAQDYLKLTNTDLNYQYFYRRDTGTHIFHLYHPTYIGLHSGRSIDDYIESIITYIKNYNVWNELPNKENTDDYFKEETSYCKNSMDYKRKFVAELAKTLVLNDCVMSGQDLQRIFNRNSIFTTYGCEYSDNGGRGIHGTIASIWKYYHDMNDYQTAYFIARAFVKQDGSYAY